MPGKVKIMYLNLYKLTLWKLILSKLKINLYHDYNVFEWLGKNIFVFLSLLSFLLLVMYVSMERLYAATLLLVSMESKFTGTC